MLTRTTPATPQASPTGTCPRAKSGRLCRACGHRSAHPPAREFGWARGNTGRFLTKAFRLWQCPACDTIHCLGPVDYQDIYRAYPVGDRGLDFFARWTLRNLLSRLCRGGLKRTDSILDYGCGRGLFVKHLRKAGWSRAAGFDRYVPEFSNPPAEEGSFDWVVANHVIEHLPDPLAFIRECLRWLKPGGLLYIATPRADGIDTEHANAALMQVHAPFHRVILSEKGLRMVVRGAGLDIIRFWRRSYFDTLFPFANYRFVDEFNRAWGHCLDRAFAPGAGHILWRRPGLLYYGLFGYFCPLPRLLEPAVLCRRTGR